MLVNLGQYEMLFLVALLVAIAVSVIVIVWLSVATGILIASTVGGAVGSALGRQAKERGLGLSFLGAAALLSGVFIFVVDLYALVVSGSNVFSDCFLGCGRNDFNAFSIDLTALSFRYVFLFAAVSLAILSARTRNISVSLVFLSIAVALYFFVVEGYGYWPHGKMPWQNYAFGVLGSEVLEAFGFHLEMSLWALYSLTLLPLLTILSLYFLRFDARVGYFVSLLVMVSTLSAEIVFFAVFLT